MPEKTILTDEWLSDRAFLHDAFAISAQLVAKNLVIDIDDQWSNLQGGSHQVLPSPGSLIFQGAVMHIGNVGEASGRFINELKCENGRWQLFLSKNGFFRRPDLLAFQAYEAFFVIDR